VLAGKLSHAEIWRKLGISSTYTYELKDRARDILRERIGRAVGKPGSQVEELQKKIADLEQLAGDQAPAIRIPETMPGHGWRYSRHGVRQAWVFGGVRRRSRSRSRRSA
jgi:hypothetical protein